MKIYDKAQWQLDGGLEKNVVIEHFDFVLHWLKDHGLLSEEGKEILEFGIDSEVSLNDAMVTKDGAAFLDRYYDKLIENSKYSLSDENKLIDLFYEEYKK